eukprot:Colp12_sorted_trinity150504_noHs@33775
MKPFNTKAAFGTASGMLRISSMITSIIAFALVAGTKVIFDGQEIDFEGDQTSDGQTAALWTLSWFTHARFFVAIGCISLVFSVLTIIIRGFTKKPLYLIEIFFLAIWCFGWAYASGLYTESLYQIRAATVPSPHIGAWSAGVAFGFSTLMIYLADLLVTVKAARNEDDD